MASKTLNSTGLRLCTASMTRMALSLALLFTSVLWAAGPVSAETDCLSCHPAKGGTSSGAAQGPEFDQRALEASIHSGVSCIGCHRGADKPGHSTRTARASCIGCHEASAKVVAAGVHGAGVPPSSAKACVPCHGSHGILPARDPQSLVAKARVSRTCSNCHEKVGVQYSASIHGRSLARGIQASPSCVDCHGEHGIFSPRHPNSPVHRSNVSLMTCSRCHEDVRLKTRFRLPSGRLASYQDSFHGLAARSGSKTVANCASCHGVHDILPSSHPRSMINKANLARTCGRCHPNAGSSLTVSSIHEVPASAAESRWIRYVRLFYLILIPMTIGGMFLHNALDWFKKLLRHIRSNHPDLGPLRLTVHERIQHVLLLTSFVALVVTGFALKFPESFWARPILSWEGEFPVRGVAHRMAAALMIFVAVYHALYVVLSRDGRRWLRDIWPRLRDFRDAAGMGGYLVGIKKSPPLFARFSYTEKIEYWAMVWGTSVMVVTGAVLWEHDFVLSIASTLVIDVATLIHYYEAILASLAILVWHFYAVIFDPDVYPVKWTFVNGRASEREVRDES